MKEIYNAVILLAPTKKELAKEDKIKKLVKEEAEYIDDKTIGEQDLAYEIEDQTSGYYFWIDFDCQPSKLEKIKSEIEKIGPLRYLLTKKPLEAVEKRKKEESAPSKAPKEKEESPKPKTEKPEKKEPKKKKAKPKKKKSKEDEKKRIEDLDKKLEEIL